MKTILAVILVVVAAGATKAQNRIKVMVGAGEGDEQKVINQVKARIGGTSRYETVEKNAIASLLVEIECITLRDEAAFQVGYACHSSVSYFPDMATLSTELFGAGTLVSCNLSGESCAEYIFESFVSGTQPEKLSRAKSELDRDVYGYTHPLGTWLPSVTEPRKKSDHP